MLLLVHQVQVDLQELLEQQVIQTVVLLQEHQVLVVQLVPQVQLELLGLVNHHLQVVHQVLQVVMVQQVMLDLLTQVLLQVLQVQVDLQEPQVLPELQI